MTGREKKRNLKRTGRQKKLKTTYRNSETREETERKNTQLSGTSHKYFMKKIHDFDTNYA